MLGQILWLSIQLEGVPWRWPVVTSKDCKCQQLEADVSRLVLLQKEVLAELQGLKSQVASLQDQQMRCGFKWNWLKNVENGMGWVHWVPYLTFENEKGQGLPS